MRDRIDPLIEERAPWLFQPGPGRRTAHRMLDIMLSYERTLTVGNAVQHLSAPEIMDRMATLLAKDIEATGLHHIPRSGPALVVANHPTGIGDGIMLWHALSRVRRDMFIYANSDILRVLPQFDEIIAPVEWRPEKRTHARTRETMAYTRTAIREGRLGVIFPSGRIAKRRGLRLHERPWMASAAMIARKYEMPVIPINIRARNSWMFYLFDVIHPTLRDITLFHEMLNKDRQPFRIAVGQPIDPMTLPEKSEELDRAAAGRDPEAGRPLCADRVDRRHGPDKVAQPQAAEAAGLTADPLAPRGVGRGPAGRGRCAVGRALDCGRAVPGWWSAICGAATPLPERALTSPQRPGGTWCPVPGAGMARAQGLPCSPPASLIQQVAPEPSPQSRPGPDPGPRRTGPMQ